MNRGKHNKERRGKRMAHFLMSTRIHMGQSSLEEIKGLGMKRAYIILSLIHI